MNKNEFYKQLLENYTVDKDKIKCNAKRAARRGGFNVSAKWLGAAGAAVITLGVGTASLVSYFNSDPVSVAPQADPQAVLARMEAAEANYRANAEAYSAEQTEMYVSFVAPLSYREMTMAFSAISEPGELSCLLIYTTDGKLHGADDKDYISLQNSKGAKNIAGVKINAPMSYYEDIRDLKAVRLVELAENVQSDESFEPLWGEEAVTMPPVTSAPSSEPIEITIPEASTEVSSDITTEITTEDTQNPEETTAAENSETQPAEPEKTVIPVQNVHTAQFISQNGLVLLTGESVHFVRVGDDMTCTVDTTYYVCGAKISWKNSTGTQLLITACNSEGERTKLYYADGASGTLTELDISAITADAELTGLYCNEAEGSIVFRTGDLEKARIYVAARNGGTLTITQAAEFYGPVTVLSYAKGELYYAAADASAGVTSLYCKSDGAADSRLLDSYSNDVKFSRSPSMDAFAVMGTGLDQTAVSRIYTGGEAVDVTVNGEISFSDLNGRIFRDADGCYCLTAAGVVEISESEAAVYTAAETGSDSYIAEIGEDGWAAVIKKQ